VLDLRTGELRRAAAISRDADQVCVRLRHAAAIVPMHSRNELHRDSCRWIHVLEIVDQPASILDRVDVVVGGGEINVTPGVAHLVRAITSSTL